MRHARLTKEYSIRDLAKIIKVTSQTISNIERGVVTPSLPHLAKLSNVLDKPISFLGCFEQLPENTLGQKIKKARLYQGLLMVDVAELLNVDAKTISNWESDSTKPIDKKLTEIESFISILNNPNILSNNLDC
ncbi:transcriptional repressor DicA [compost metagenome]